MFGAIVRVPDAYTRHHAIEMHTVEGCVFGAMRVPDAYSSPVPPVPCRPIHRDLRSPYGHADVRSAVFAPPRRSFAAAPCVTPLPRWGATDMHQYA